MIADLIRWNFSKYGKMYDDADGCVVSFPKSGRTWLRVFYYSYLANIFEAEFTFDHSAYKSFPKLIFTHDRWEHRFLPGWWAFVRGRQLIPLSTRRTKPIVLLVRDPRDVVVSLYFHLSKRPNVFGWTPQPIGEMVRCPKFGIATVIKIMNQWLGEWHGTGKMCLIRYEDLSSDSGQFRTFLEFLGIAPISETAFQKAVQFSTFENMHELEGRGFFQSNSLEPGNATDPNSFKTRRGKVNGFTDYLTESDIAFVNAQMRKLDGRFGYGDFAEVREFSGAPVGQLA